LSPEDYDDDEMKRLTLVLLEDGIRIFVFSFHSPSLMPGGTPYVSTEADLFRFLGKCQRYFKFFLHDLKGVPMTPIAVKQALESGSVVQKPSAA
jgi:hypothetical protein